MENTYYLIVEQRAGGRRLRTLDEYASADRLIADAADYEAGEFPGRWVGALELSFDDSGRLIAALPLVDIAADVHAELASRLEWCQRQTALDRWSPR
ncbi:MAG: hypothetical protein A3D94_03445 [Alphaproteobacteria bacterium RIFCSPHIGHO2_12_FULL_66_14]|jgi:hypothetical protein|nr:MAG: hypothetical protein A3D94_03445 [Alphaproteobacteria bacterium RIFCSPHIGHO2_12_FULL_66_14]